MKARIVKNPKILAGKPVIAGTRIPVTLILNLLAHGQGVEQIIDDYPDLTPEDIKAAIIYTQKIVEKEKPALGTIVAHEIYHRRRPKL